MKRGEIYRADLDPVVGSEQGGIRPVLIIQNDRGNLHSPTVIGGGDYFPPAQGTLAHSCGIARGSLRVEAGFGGATGAGEDPGESTPEQIFGEGTRTGNGSGGCGAGPFPGYPGGVSRTMRPRAGDAQGHDPA